MTQVALITGAAKRVGAVMAQSLHKAGYRVIIHYRHSADAAQTLCDQLNAARANSAKMLQADFNHLSDIQHLAQQAIQCWGQVDVLINNASEFFETPIEKTTPEDWERLINSNVKGAYFLIQALYPTLKAQTGHIINVTDKNVLDHPPTFSVYALAKTALITLTDYLKKELAPEIHVGLIAPGHTLPPESYQDDLPIETPPELLAELILAQLTGQQH